MQTGIPDSAWSAPDVWCWCCAIWAILAEATEPDGLCKPCSTSGLPASPHRAEHAAAAIAEARASAPALDQPSLLD